MKYIVVIGDIVSSRKVTQRSRLQHQLKATLDTLNRKKVRGAVSPYTITLGDEFQAVFTQADTLFSHAAEILLALHPVKARFSFGIGEIETPINRRQAIGMDGPAFHEARLGLEELKSRKSLFAVRGLQRPATGLIAPSLDLVSHLCVDWKRSRLKVFAMLLQRTPVKAIAASTGMTDKAVYKSIGAGGLHIIQRIDNQIVAAINSEVTGK